MNSEAEECPIGTKKSARRNSNVSKTIGKGRSIERTSTKRA